MKLRKVTQNDPSERLAVSIRKSVLQTLAQYQEFYQTTYDESIERSQLVEEILRDFMASDKNFQKSLSAPKPAATSVAPATSAAPFSAGDSDLDALGRP